MLHWKLFVYVVLLSIAVSALQLTLPAGGTRAADDLFLNLPVERTAMAARSERAAGIRRGEEMLEATRALSAAKDAEPLLLLQRDASAERREDMVEAERRMDDRAMASTSGLRRADIALMERLGTTDLGTGSVGGSLVSNLLGSSIRIHSDSHYSTVFNNEKSNIWKQRHQVLIEEQEMASIRLHNQGGDSAASSALPLPESAFEGSFRFNRSAVVNGTFVYHGKVYNMTDFPRRPPPLRSLIPLLRFFDAEHKDHICNTDPYEFSDRQGAYQFQGIVAFIYSKRIRRDRETEKDDDLVPFYRYWNKENWPKSSDHFFSLDPNLKDANFVKQGIVGFIYADPQASLVPLNEFYSGSAKSHLYSVTDEKTLKVNGDSYEFKGILGYVQPLDALERRKAEIAAQKLAEAEKNNPKVETVVKLPEQQEAKKDLKKWHPGQPLFVGNQDWSK